MRVLIVEPQRAPYEKEIEHTLDAMQAIVGGLIEVIYPIADDPSIALVCNDEGKLQDLPLNRALYGAQSTICDIVSGTFFLCAAPSDSDSFASLTDEQLAIGKERFGKSELFFCTEKGIAVVQLSV